MGHPAAMQKDVWSVWKCSQSQSAVAITRTTFIGWMRRFGWQLPPLHSLLRRPSHPAAMQKDVWSVWKCSQSQSAVAITKTSFIGWMRWSLDQCEQRHREEHYHHAVWF